jgi:hypothetical protein
VRRGPAIDRGSTAGPEGTAERRDLFSPKRHQGRARRFALNFSWSVIVFLAGCLVIYAATLAYTWLNPFPLPAAVRWLSVVFIAFPVIAVLLHWLPLLVYRQRSA